MNSPKYNRPPSEPDIEAEIYFLQTTEGGKTKPVYSGYRPSHDFGIPDMLNDAQHEYIESKTVKPGETANAYLWFLCPDYQTNRLITGMEFTVQEGNKIVGKGKIKRIINQVLQKQTT